jgi:hypothetical protein
MFNPFAKLFAALERWAGAVERAADQTDRVAAGLGAVADQIEQRLPATKLIEAESPEPANGKGGRATKVAR